MIKELFKKAHLILDHMVIKFQFSAIGYSYEFVSFVLHGGYHKQTKTRNKSCFIYTVAFKFEVYIHYEVIYKCYSDTVISIHFMLFYFCCLIYK